MEEYIKRSTLGPLTRLALRSVFGRSAESSDCRTNNDPRPAVGAAGAESAAKFTFRHFPQLDGLRGLAIMLVLTGHVLAFGFGIRNDLGGLGVLLFFQLSGFLITGILDREKTLTGDIFLSSFYARRCLRLFPALLVFLPILCVLIRNGAVTDTPWYAIAACLLYVRNIWGRGSTSSHLWSLSLEEQFYTIWPWIVKMVDRATVMRIAVLGATAITIFRMVAIWSEWFDYRTGAYYQRPWFRFDSILLGCFIALWLCDSAKSDRLRAYFSTPALPLVVWPGILAWSAWGETLTHAWYLTVQMALASLIFLHLLLSRESLYIRVFSHPVAVWVGRLSYSLYLWQQLFTIDRYPLWGGLRTFPLNIFAALALSLASYFLIEKPFLKLKAPHRGRRSLLTPFPSFPKVIGAPQSASTESF